MVEIVEVLKTISGTLEALVSLLEKLVVMTFFYFGIRVICEILKKQY